MNKYWLYFGFGFGIIGFVEVGLVFVYIMVLDVVIVGCFLIGELELNECNLLNGDFGGVIWIKILI